MTSVPAAIAAPSDKLRRVLDWCVRRPFTTAAIIYLIVAGCRFMLARDFSEWDHVFVLAARQLRQGGDIYRLPADLQEEHPFPFSYPPFQALMAIPFSYLPAFLPRLAWYLVNALCLVLMWRLAWRVSGGGKLQNIERPDWREYVICILGLACAMRFVEDTLEHRQTDLVIGALLFGGCLAWQRRHDWTAASLWGAAAAFKCTPLLLAGYLLWRRRWAAAVWLVVVAVGLNLLPDLVHRPPRGGIWLGQWYQQVVRAKSDVGAWYVDPILNQSLAGAAFRFSATTASMGAHDLQVTTRSPRLPQWALKAILYGADAALVAATALAMGWPWRRQIDSNRAAVECCAVLILMLMLSPMSHKTHFCILLLPGFVVARLAVQKRSAVAWLGVAACITLVVVLDRSIIGRPRGNMMMWLGSVTAGSLALWIACLWSLVRERRTLPTVLES
jgi:hypothetical protein